MEIQGPLCQISKQRVCGICTGFNFAAFDWHTYVDMEIPGELSVDHF
jgi:hypothetical protein